MKFLSSIESWNSFFEWASLFTVALTFVAGAGTIVTARIINRRQTVAILELQKAESQAKEAQQKVEVALAEASTKQAEAEKALLEVKSKLAFRTISKEDAARMSASLTQYAPQSFDILLYPDDQECVSFANEIYNILLRAGWVLDKSGSWLGMVLEVGVKIEFGKRNSDVVGPAAHELASELASAGVQPISVEQNSRVDHERIGRITIRVGKKP